MRTLAPALLLSLVAWVAPGRADTEPALIVAKDLLESIRAENFNAAAGAFRYPDSYTSAERDADRASIASSLRSLFGLTGNIPSVPPPEVGAFVVLKLTVRAGDRAHPLPPADPSTSSAYRFKTPLLNYPDAAINVELDRVAGEWRVRAIALALPATDASSAGRMAHLIEQMRAARSAQPTATKPGERPGAGSGAT